MSNGAGGPTPEEVFAIPALTNTPAGHNKALTVLDGAYIIGVAPRTADAISSFMQALYPTHSRYPAQSGIKHVMYRYALTRQEPGIYPSISVDGNVDVCRSEIGDPVGVRAMMVVPAGDLKVRHHQGRHR